jgi:5-methylcytosine-specific restriction endonuclease McrA
MTSLSKELSKECFTRDGFKCRHCGSRNNLSAHHMIFRSQGGLDELWNLITLCSFCHLNGIHEANLKIVEPADANYVVKFIRKLGWKPK